MDETRVTGELPNMRIEITHRADADAGAEVMTINLTATPDFRSALPLAGGLASLPLAGGLMTPLPMMLAAWQTVMAPWAALWGAHPPQLSGGNSPQLSGGNSPPPSP